MKHLTSAEVKTLFPDVTTRTYPKSQILFYPGDKPESIYFIVSGTVKYYDIGENGDEKIIHLLRPGTVFPMLYTFDTISEIAAFYSALDDVEVMMLQKDIFMDAMETNVELANKVLKTLLEDMMDIINHVNSISKTDSKSKVLYVLEYLAAKHSSSRTKLWHRVNFPINQQIIADLAGVTRETVSGIMQEFESEKVIRAPKQLILDINKTKLEASAILPN